MPKINKKIEEARKKLRELYKKYTSELYEVVNKIDTFLEALEDKQVSEEDLVKEGIDG